MALLQDGESESLELLGQIQKTLQAIQADYKSLAAAVDTINGRVNVLSGVKQVHDAANHDHINEDEGSKALVVEANGPLHDASDRRTHNSHKEPVSATSPARSSAISRIILTTYPGQSGIDPLPMSWGHQDPLQRGPVVVSRSQSTLRRRNGASPNERSKTQN